MSLLNIGILAGVAGGAWWLTGYDSHLARDGRRSDFWRRFLRIIATLFLVEIMIAVPPTIIVLGVFVGALWASCLAELVTRWGRRFLDPGFHDHRPLDLGKSRRYMDTIAHLIHHGRRDEAVKLCQQLKQSGEVEPATIEMTLGFLGVKPERAELSKPFAEIAQLRAQGKFAEAESLLKSLLAKKPEDLAAAMTLVRLYAEDWRQPAKAHEILRKLEKQPHVSAEHIEFARRSIDQWSRPKPEKIITSARTESVEELLAQGFYGTAIERLEQKTAEQPQNFEAWLKLAEAYGRHAGNVHRAEKIVRQMEANPAFSAAQILTAKTQLKAWREIEIHGNKSAS